MAILTSTILKFDNAPRASLQRAAAELANAVAIYTLNQINDAGLVATATNTTGVKTTATTQYFVNGTLYTKAATDPLYTLGSATSNTAVAAASWQKYLLLLNSSGTATVQEASQSLVSAAAVSYKNLSAVSKWAPLMSLLSAGTTIAGVLTIATDATHTFTPGTTALTATGITATFQDGLDPMLMPVIANTGGLIFGLGV